MILLPTDTNATLLIQENQSLQIGNFRVEVLSYLGQLTTDIYYFKVNILGNILELETDTFTEKLGLLRVGSDKGGLYRELKLRETLGDYKMVAELLAYTMVESVIINYEQHQPEHSTQDDKLIDNTSSDTHENIDEYNLKEQIISTDSQVEITSQYLEEEYYPEIQTHSESSSSKLLLLTDFIEDTKTLDTWLKSEPSLEDSLFITSQVCQFLRYVHERNWCFILIEPRLIKIGTPCTFFDLTSAYPVGETLPFCLSGSYCASELALNKSLIHESMSTYTVGALLYYSIHQQPLSPHQTTELTINPIPGIYQILKITLSPIPEERFTLSQLLTILLEHRQAIRNPKIRWNVASRSTVGLSVRRLQNEDNYGVKQQQFSDSETMILGVVADGMGGLSYGEVASKLAVQTVLEEPITPNLKTVEKRNEWLMSLFDKANEVISNNVKDAGTTLSVVLCLSQQLMIAHVGDSRIYLLRQGKISQLSEDHSLVAMLIASNQITEAESEEHPDRNVLTKSLGAKNRLSDGYVQNLKRTTPDLSMNLENNDILLLCTDGVWDLVSKKELEEIFNNHQDLQLAVNQTIDKVLELGASDNATLLAMQYYIQ